jgi:hypothetical protein
LFLVFLGGSEVLPVNTGVLRGVTGLLFENYIVDASILIRSNFYDGPWFRPHSLRVGVVGFFWFSRMFF